MPIRPENRHRYPADWKNISQRIRFERASGRCECSGECGRPRSHLDQSEGRCRSRHGDKAWTTGATVVLTVAHLNHVPEDCRDDNLKAMCNACHLHYDGPHHAQTRARTAAAAASAGMDPLFTIEGAS